MKSIIIGCRRSGFSLLGAMLDCHPSTEITVSGLDPDKRYSKAFGNLCMVPIEKELVEKRGTELLGGILHELSQDDKLRFIWIVRNPVISSCSYQDNLSLNVQNGLRYWHRGNCLLWYFYMTLPQNRRLLIRFEDLLLSDCVPKSVFSFCGIPFSPQYIRYGDFDHEYPSVQQITRGYPYMEQIDSYPKSRLVKEYWKQYMNEPLVQWLGYQYMRFD